MVEVNPSQRVTTEEKMRQAREECVAVIVYLTAPDDFDELGGADVLYNATRFYSLALSPAASLALAHQLIAAASDGQAVFYRDEAAFVVQQFATCGVDRQAMLAPAVRGLSYDRDEYYQRPNEDPYRGFNDAVSRKDSEVCAPPPPEDPTVKDDLDTLIEAYKALPCERRQVALTAGFEVVETLARVSARLQVDWSAVNVDAKLGLPLRSAAAPAGE